MSGYAKGTRVWFPDKEAGWIGGEVTNKDVDDGGKVVLTFVDEKGKESTVEATVDTLTTANEALPPLKNPPLLETQEDLANLSNLNEPSVLHAISTRYDLHLPYTYSGIVLIAINPFYPLQIYGQEMIQSYSGKKKGELEPHLFAIAEEALDCMRRGQTAGGEVGGTADQTIVVSGESGAGKTVSAKFILRYFASVEDPSRPVRRNRARGPGGAAVSEEAGMSEVERQMLATNPIMEAFGNAKTTRNDNSSRFGKYMEILFDKDQEIVGARIRTYLLERSRLVYQPEIERNYHIFYQLCAGAPTKERKDLGLDIDTTKFFYLNQGGPRATPIPGVDDAAEFDITQKALSTVGITVEKQWQIFRLLAALLHLGNIKITQTRTEALLSDDDPALKLATGLLGIPAAEFKKWIIKKQLVTRSEKIVTALNAPAATVVRDSVAKFVYACVWEYLVAVVNESLLGEGGSGVEKAEKFIGVLDIYGFEHFKKNSLEQFFINYANEKLQQEFNAHVFKLEQEEYVREKINWTFIDYSDNQPCIDVIEGKLGILSLLDEESRLPSGADTSFVTKLHKQLDTPQYKAVFKKPRFGGNSFTVAHYAIDVEYEVDGFIDKNRDTVPDEQLALLQNTTNEFLRAALEAALAPPPPPPATAATPTPGRDSPVPSSSAASTSNSTAPSTPSTPATSMASKRSSVLSPTFARSAAFSSMAAPQQGLTVGRKPGGRKPTLGSIFKNSLISLMDTISHTNVHYIRCIKPNERKAAWEWDAPQVLGQLRACGVLETIRISCAGYPSRWVYEDFAERYYMLINSSHWQGDLKDVCALILAETIKEEDKFQLGLTKLFFRAGMLAYLEGLRADRLNHLVTLVQKNLRRRMALEHYRKLRSSSLKIQVWWRAISARKFVANLRREAAAVKIQKIGRGFVQRKRFLETRQGVVKIQSVMRGFRARQTFKEQRLQTTATRLQSLWRGLLARRQFNHEVRGVIHLQSCHRRQMARKQLKGLKAEARSATKLKEVSYKLENKVIELTQTLQRRTAEKKDIQSRLTELEELQVLWTGKHEESEARAQKLHAELQKPTVPQEHYDELLQSRDLLDVRLGDTEKKIAERDTEIKRLGDEVAKHARELEARQKVIEASTAQASEDANTIAGLKTDLSNLRDSLNRSEALAALNRNAPPPASPTFLPNGLRALENGSGDPNLLDPRSQASRGFNNSPSRRYSSGGLADSPRPGDDVMADARRAQASQNRAVSVAAFAPDAQLAWQNKGLVTYDDPEEEVMKMMEDAEKLDEDVLNGLIRNLKIPIPTLQNLPTHKEVVFPAHLIGLATNEMWKFGLIPESERFLANVMQTIQQYVMSFKLDDAIIPGIFWLSNVHELLSFVCVAEHDVNEGIYPGEDDGFGRPFEWADYEKLVRVVKHDLDSLEYNIYHTWIAETKKKLAKMVIPAIIESQSLPGFKTTEGGSRLFNRLISTAGPAFSMDDILNILNKVWKALKSYHMEESVTQQVVTEILKLIGVTAFNDLLMRRNFCSWKRAMQIQYNITRLEEWCKSHDMPEGVLQLEHLMQATKLLQLKKGSLADIDIIYDVCWMLTPTQIQKLISQYFVADFETPISPEILRAVASRVVPHDRTDHLLLPPENDEAGPYELPLPRDIGYLETFVPEYLTVPHLRRFVLLVAA